MRCSNPADAGFEHRLSKYPSAGRWLSDKGNVGPLLRWCGRGGPLAPATEAHTSELRFPERRSMNRRIAMVGIAVFVVAIAGARTAELGHEQYAQLPNRVRAAPHYFSHRPRTRARHPHRQGPRRPPTRRRRGQAGQGRAPNLTAAPPTGLVQGDCPTATASVIAQSLFRQATIPGRARRHRSAERSGKLACAEVA